MADRKMYTGRSGLKFTSFQMGFFRAVGRRKNLESASYLNRGAFFRNFIKNVREDFPSKKR